MLCKIPKYYKFYQNPMNGIQSNIEGKFLESCALAE